MPTMPERPDLSAPEMPSTPRCECGEALLASLCWLCPRCDEDPTEALRERERERKL